MINEESESFIVSNISASQFNAIIDLILSKSLNNVISSASDLHQLSNLVAYLNALSKHHDILTNFFSYSSISKLFAAVNNLTDAYIISRNPDIKILLVRLCLAIANSLLINKSIFNQFNLCLQKSPYYILLNITILIEGCFINHTDHPDFQRINLKYLIAPVRLMFLLLYKKNDDYLEIKNFATFVVKLTNLIISNIKNILWLFFKHPDTQIHEDLLIELLKTLYVLFHNYKKCINFTTGDVVLMHNNSHNHHHHSHKDLIQNERYNSSASPNLNLENSLNTTNHDSRTRSPSINYGRSPGLNSISARLQPIIHGLSSELRPKSRGSESSDLNEEHSTGNTDYDLLLTDAKAKKVDFNEVHIILVLFAKLVSLDRKFSIYQSKSKCDNSNDKSTSTSKFSLSKSGKQDKDTHKQEPARNVTDVSVNLYKNIGSLMLSLPFEFYNQFFFINHYKKNSLNMENSVMKSIFEIYSIKPIKILQILLFGSFSIIKLELTDNRVLAHDSNSKERNQDLIGHITNMNQDNIFVFLTLVNHVLKLKNYLRNDIHQLKQEIHNNRIRYKKTNPDVNVPKTPSIDNIQFEKSLEFFQKLNFIDEISDFFEKFLLPFKNLTASISLDVLSNSRSTRLLKDVEIILTMLSQNYSRNGSVATDNTEPYLNTSSELEAESILTKSNKNKSKNIYNKNIDTIADGTSDTHNEQSRNSRPLRKSKSTGILRNIHTKVNMSSGRRPSNTSTLASFNERINTKTPPRNDTANHSFTANTDLHGSSYSSPRSIQRKESTTKLSHSPFKMLGLSPKVSFSNLYNKYNHQRGGAGGATGTATTSPKKDTKLGEKNMKNTLAINAESLHFNNESKLVKNRPKISRQESQKHSILEPPDKPLDELLAILACKVDGVGFLQKNYPKEFNERNVKLVLANNCYNCLMKCCKNPFVLSAVKTLIIQIYFNLITEHSNAENEHEEDDQQQSEDTSFSTTCQNDVLYSRNSIRKFGNHLKTRKLDFGAERKTSNTGNSRKLESTTINSSSSDFGKLSNGKSSVSELPSNGVRHSASLDDDFHKSCHDDLVKASTINDFFLKFQNLKNLQKFLIIFLGNDLFYLIFMFFQSNNININEQELRIITEYLHLNYKSNSASKKSVTSAPNGLSNAPDFSKNQFGSKYNNRGMSVVLHFGNASENDTIFDKEISVENNQGNLEGLDFDMFQVSDDENEFVDISLLSKRSNGNIIAADAAAGNANNGDGGGNGINHQKSFASGFPKIPFIGNNTNKTPDGYANSHNGGSISTGRQLSNFGSISTKSSSIASRTKQFLSRQKSYKLGPGNCSPDPNLVSRFEKFAFETSGNGNVIGNANGSGVIDFGFKDSFASKATSPNKPQLNNIEESIDPKAPIAITDHGGHQNYQDQSHNSYNQGHNNGHKISAGIHQRSPSFSSSPMKRDGMTNDNDGNNWPPSQHHLRSKSTNDTIVISDQIPENQIDGLENGNVFDFAGTVNDMNVTEKSKLIDGRREDNVTSNDIINVNNGHNGNQSGKDNLSYTNDNYSTTLNSGDKAAPASGNRFSRSSLTSAEKYQEAEKFFSIIEKLSKK